MLVIHASLHVNCFESIENNSEIPHLTWKEVRDHHHNSFQILVLCRLFFQVCFNCNTDKCIDLCSPKVVPFHVFVRNTYQCVLKLSQRSP